ncbi:ester cyclase [Mesorhizobium sp. B2-5-7]|nr:ester cyclase [Mesorhizobium sp. B2-5-7]TPL77886.1 ester cyclase [Mesorhizobium sp. B2-3-15]TPM05010.1 ester cyclase [Mesorhizobium sp. B2-3-10]
MAGRFAATLSAGDIDAFSELFADTYVNHQQSAAAPPPANVSPKQATVAFFKARLTAMPDLKVVTEVVVADKDHVAASFVYSGTQGVYFGVAPTGRTLHFTSCDIFSGGRRSHHRHWAWVISQASWRNCEPDSSPAHRCEPAIGPVGRPPCNSDGQAYFASRLSAFLRSASARLWFPLASHAWLRA